MQYQGKMEEEQNLRERLSMIYLTNRRTYFKGWVEMLDEKSGQIYIDKSVHPNFPDGGQLPSGIITVPYTRGLIQRQ